MWHGEPFSSSALGAGRRIGWRGSSRRSVMFMEVGALGIHVQAPILLTSYTHSEHTSKTMAPHCPVRFPRARAVPSSRQRRGIEFEAAPKRSIFLTCAAPAESVAVQSFACMHAFPFLDPFSSFPSGFLMSLRLACGDDLCFKCVQHRKPSNVLAQLAWNSCSSWCTLCKKACVAPSVVDWPFVVGIASMESEKYWPSGGALLAS